MQHSAHGPLLFVEGFIKVGSRLSAREWESRPRTAHTTGLHNHISGIASPVPFLKTVSHGINVKNVTLNKH